jgi:hypothetical protein
MTLDLVYIGIGAGFFLLTWGFVRLCETLEADQRGEH